MFSTPSPNIGDEAGQALWLWVLFLSLMVIINGTIPFAFGVDLHAWTYSKTKDVIIHIVIYAGIFLIAPLILTKSWKIVRETVFLLPLLVGALGAGVSSFAPSVAALVPIVLLYLHWRFDLSNLGIRSRGLKGDLVAVLVLGLLPLIPIYLRLGAFSFTLDKALLATMDRLFSNPASTTENLFYFGFLAERLSHRTGRWMTPLLTGAMYTAHEMTNPEYWYAGMPFALTFVGIMIWASVYLWRRSWAAIWLGDGLSRLFGGSF